MEFISLITDSVVLMWVLTIFFGLVCFRCMVYGAMAGTSALLRIILTVFFAALTYFCWRYAMNAHVSTLIDRFVFESLNDVKHLISVIMNKFF